MTFIRLLMVLTFALFLIACATDSYQEIQTTTVNKNQIRVYYGTFPSCEYDVVGHIEVNGQYHSKQSLFQFMADEAEKMKAKAVIIDYLKSLNIREYVAVGKAILCR